MLETFLTVVVEVELVVIYANTLQFVLLHNIQWLLVVEVLKEHTQQVLQVVLLLLLQQELIQQVLVKQLQVLQHIQLMLLVHPLELG